MKLILWILLPLLIINVATAGGIKMKNDLNFKINHNKLKNGRMEIAIKFIPADRFRRNKLSSLDVEDLSSDNDAEIAFIKGAFIINKPITDFDHEFFLDRRGIRKIYDAKSVDQLTDKSFRVHVSEMGISMDFDLVIDFKDDYVMTSNRFDRLIDAAVELDPTLPEAAKYQLLTQDNFSRIFNRSVTINMFIPYGNQTLVVSYSLASAKKSSIKRIDSIPFVNAYKILSGQLKDCMERTYKVMESK